MITDSCEVAFAVPLNVTDGGENDVVGLVDGVTIADSVTVPVNPPVPGVMVTLKRATDPALMVAVRGLAETV